MSLAPPHSTNHRTFRHVSARHERRSGCIWRRGFGLSVACSREFDLRLQVLHLNHNLRGDESRGDAEFVRLLAATLQLPCTMREANFADSIGNLEQEAREARLAFFREMISSGLVDRVALGHTRSDQAETVLFRFLRGSGTAGLAGIRPVTADGIVRPLFDVERTDVEGFLRERSISWREDSTNRSRRFARNRIRHELLPQLERDWNPGDSPARWRKPQIGPARRSLLGG